MAGKLFVFSFGDVEVREREFAIVKAGEVLAVEPKAFRVLLFLLRNPQKLITKEELLDAVWGDTAVSENSLARSVALLRRLLGDETRNPRYIETVATVGYRFVCKVEVAQDAAGSLEEADTPTGEVHAISANSGTEIEKGAADSQKTRKARSHLRLGIAVASIAVLLLISIAIWESWPRLPTVTNIVRITNDRKAKNPLNSPVTDGVRLYFVEGMPWGSGSEIAQTSETGGETTSITTSLKEVLAIAAISPDRSKLLIPYGSGNHEESATEFWVQPLPAGAPYRLGNIMASNAIWTPDGTHILYAYKHKMTIANEDGSDPHVLAEVPGNVFGVRYSPDGRLIRFHVFQPQGEASSLWEMRADGTNLHPLLPDWKESPDQCCGTWSADGKYYFFQAGYGDEETVWVMSEQHSLFHRNPGPRRLTSGPLRFTAPAPSRDGKRLFVIGDETRVELFRYDPQSRRFDPYLGGLSAGPVDFSPDGKWIAYVSYPDMTLWRSRLDLSETMQLTFPPVRAYEPRWSPDGTRIAFMDVQFHRPWKIGVLSASGGDRPKQIAESAKDDADTDPTWMPDGKSIVFSRASAAGEGKPAIYLADLSNGSLVLIPDSNGLYSPRLSPDGRFIAAISADVKKLMLFDQSTNSWSKLMEGEELAFNEWSRDGKDVYMRESEGGIARIVRVRIKDRNLEDVLSLKNFPQLADLFANWFGLTPDGGVLLMRDSSIQEIYALTLEKK